MCDALQETVEENTVAHEIKADDPNGDHHKRIIELETKIEMISQMGASANGDPGFGNNLNNILVRAKENLSWTHRRFEQDNVQMIDISRLIQQPFRRELRFYLYFVNIIIEFKYYSD